MKLVAHNGSRVWGGNEKWLATVAQGLARRGHAVVVSCREGGAVAERLGELGVPTTPVRPRGDLDPAAAVRFARWLGRERPDAVLATSWNRLPAVAWAAKRGRARRLAIRMGIVRPFPRPGPTRWAVRAADAVIVNAEEIRRDWLATAPPEVAARVRVVYNGIAPAAAPPPDHRERFRAGLGLATDTLLVAAAGHVHRRKGFDVLLDAFARQEEGARLVIAGTGPHEPALRERARALGVAERIHWLGFRPDVPAVLAACDLFVLSSRNEGMANVMLEAMAAGVPVVATAVSGVEYALGGEAGGVAAGWIVPPEDPAAMAAAMREVLDGPRAAVAVRVAEASRRIESRFGIERMIDEVEAILFAEGA